MCLKSKMGSAVSKSKTNWKQKKDYKNLLKFLIVSCHQDLELKIAFATTTTTTNKII